MGKVATERGAVNCKRRRRTYEFKSAGAKDGPVAHLVRYTMDHWYTTDRAHSRIQLVYDPVYDVVYSYRLPRNM